MKPCLCFQLGKAAAVCYPSRLYHAASAAVLSRPAAPSPSELAQPAPCQDTCLQFPRGISGQGSNLYPGHVLFGFQEHRSSYCVYLLGYAVSFAGDTSQPASYSGRPASSSACCLLGKAGPSQPTAPSSLMKGDASNKTLQVRGTPFPRAGSACALRPEERALPEALAVSFVQGFAAVALGTACSQPE